MNRKVEVTLLMLQLQVGLIGIEQVSTWLEKELMTCDESDTVFQHIASAVSIKEHDEMVQALKEFSLDFDAKIEAELINLILKLAQSNEERVVKVAHCLEHFEHIDVSTFVDRAAYFKCSIEDIEADVYGNIVLLKEELVEYLKSKN